MPRFRWNLRRRGHLLLHREKSQLMMESDMLSHAVGRFTREMGAAPQKVRVHAASVPAATLPRRVSKPSSNAGAYVSGANRVARRLRPACAAPPAAGKRNAPLSRVPDNESCQYTSITFGRRCCEAGVRPSMVPLVIAMAHRRIGIAHARSLRYAWSGSRIHSSIGYRSPLQLEDELMKSKIGPRAGSHRRAAWC